MNEITLHPAQSAMYSALFVEKSARHVVGVASRGLGKSYLGAACAQTAVVELLELDWSVPNKNVYVIAPTHSQATDIYYPLFDQQMAVGAFCSKKSRADGLFTFPKDVNLKLVSYEAIERLRGTGAYFVLLDEISSWTKGMGAKEAWEGVIEPCLSTRWSPKMAAEYGAPSPGRSLTIATPKGYNYLYDMYNFQEVDSDWKGFHFDYRHSPYLDEDEIARLKERLDPLQFRREYGARFEDSGNQVFYCFDRKIHVSNEVEDFYKGYDEADSEVVHIALDFNVGIQASSAWAVRGGQAHCIENWRGHPDTETTAEVFKERFKGHRVIVYPDPSGKARKTSAPVGRTDFSILEDAGFTVLSRRAAPPIVDSVNSVNGMLKNSNDRVNVFVHPRCKNVIRSLERTVWVDNNPDTATIDKKEGVEHESDGIRYFFEFNWPIRGNKKRTAQGHNF